MKGKISVRLSYEDPNGQTFQIQRTVPVIYLNTWYDKNRILREMFSIITEDMARYNKDFNEIFNLVEE